MEVEQGFYEKISAWLLVAIVSIGSSWVLLLRKMNADRIEALNKMSANRFEVLEKSCGDILNKVVDHDDRLSAHDIHLSNNTLKLEALQSDITEIKKTIETIDTNIAGRDQVLNDKLDRLLER